MYRLELLSALRGRVLSSTKADVYSFEMSTKNIKLYGVMVRKWEFQLALKRFPNSSVSSLIWSWLTPGRASDHQKTLRDFKIIRSTNIIAACKISSNVNQ